MPKSNSGSPHGNCSEILNGCFSYQPRALADLRQSGTAILGELMGHGCGFWSGKGGSMHLRDADLVYAVAPAALDNARTGDGPSLIEVQTFRHGGHSCVDPGKYRPDKVFEAWMERDSITLSNDRLLADGVEEAAIAPIEAEQVDAGRFAGRYL